MNLVKNNPPVFTGGGRINRIRPSVAGSLFIIPLAVLAVFFLLPVLSIFKNIGAADFLKTLQNSYYQSVIGFTFLQAAVSTVSAVLIGLPGAWIMSHLDFKGKRFLNSLTTVPFVLPSVLVVLGFVLCFGNSGIINSLIMKIVSLDKPHLKILYSFKAIIMAHTFYNFPVSLRIVSSAWKQSGRSRIEAAEILGAGRIRIFFTITLPALLPSIIASASLVFIFCFMSFAIILVLGGGPAFTTIEVEIYRLARITLDIEAAASLALTGALLTGLLTYIYIKLQKRATVAAGIDSPIAERKFTRMPVQERVFIIIYLVVVIVLIIGPLAAVVFRSFQGRAGWRGDIVFTLKSYRTVFSSGSLFKSVGNSILYATGAMLISVPAGLIAAYATARGLIRFSGAAETLFMLPMGVSSIVLGLGYYSMLSLISVNLSNRGILIVLAHSVIAMPFAVRTLTTGIRGISKSLLEASGTLGAGFVRTFIRIELPLLKGSLISAAAFAFCISAGEINAALILSDGASPTMPIAVYRLISSYKFFGACAMGSILMLICGIAFYLIDRYGGNEVF